VLYPQVSWIPAKPFTP